MPGEYDFKGPEHYKALLTHHTDALAKAALATGITKQDHLQRAKFYAQKLKEHPLHTKKKDVTVNESIVDAVKRGAEHVKRSATVAAGKTLLSSPPGTDEIGKFPGAYTVAAGAGYFANELSGGKLGDAVKTVANKAKGAVSGVRKTLKMGEDWAVGPQEGPTPVLAIQASRKKSKYKDPEGGELLNQGDEPSVTENATEEGDSRHTLDERRGLMRMALRGVRMARIRAQREAKRAADARRDAEAAAGGGGDDGGPIDDQPMFHKPARKFKTTNEEKTEKPHPKGTRVVVSHKGHQKVGKVIRHDPGGPDSSPFYIVDVGEYGSHKVMAHNVRKEDLDEAKMTAAQKKKREEVAMAIKRDKPGMPMGKKMAIATSVAMKTVKKEGKVSSELPTNPKNLPLLKERDPSTGRLAKSRAARRVEEIVNCGKNKIDTEPVYNQLSPASGGTGYVNT